jgi:hypothetical protein
MRKQLICVAAVVALVPSLLAVGSALAGWEVFRTGNLVIEDNGGISPTKLPMHRQAPISAYLSDRLGTTDGTHPPPVQEVAVDLDRNIQVNARGLPVCRRGQLDATTTGAARKVCGAALVGSGTDAAEVAFPEQAPFTATGPVLLFNGGVHGDTTFLLIHTYLAVPTPTAVVATVKISRAPGRYGLHAVVDVPRIAGGAGSVTQFKLRIDRRFTYKGRRQSFLTASCPSGHSLVKGRALFADGVEIHLSRVLPCTPAR